MMSLWRFIRRKFLAGSEHHPQKTEPRYDNVQIKNVTDGTTIKGHDAVKEYFEKEKDLVDEHGSSIMFQVYRINLQGETLKEFQGKRLTEIKVDGEFVSGLDTVASVKNKVRSLIEEAVRLQSEKAAKVGLKLEEADRITFFFNYRPMQDDTKFYADNFIMLPALGTGIAASM